MKELNWIWIFAVKTLIVATAFFAGVAVLLPNTDGIRARWDGFISQRENQALVLSFIQNPVALTLAGERDLEQNRYEEAALKFELAVGLLEMHGASAATMQSYQTRLQRAQKLAQQASRGESTKEGR